MISNSKQDWQVGATVKVGFLHLVVKSAVWTPGDYRPDLYILTNKEGSQLYKFVPHHGIKKITAHEAKEIIEAADRNAANVAEKAIEKSLTNIEIYALFA